MEPAGADGSLSEAFGHIITYLSAVGTGFLGGRVKDFVSDVNAALGDIDEAATFAERQLRLHGKGEKDADGLAKVFTARSDLGLLIDRQFGKKSIAVVHALTLFSNALDTCDPDASVGMAYGTDPKVSIENVRGTQRALRRAILSTLKGKAAKFIGRKAVAAE